MKSIYFLNNYFKAYIPYDSYLFSVFLISFKELNICTNEELEKCILDIRDNVNKKDIKLILKYALSRGHTNIITKILTLFFSKTSGNIVYHEINEIKRYGVYVRSKKEKNINYDYFKSYFPNVTFLDYSLPYKEMKPNIYYFIREQLVECNNKKEILKKLNNPEFKLFISNWFHDISNEMPNKRKIYFLVEKVCSDIELILTITNPEKLYLDSIKDTKKEISKILDINLLSFVRKGIHK